MMLRSSFLFLAVLASVARAYPPAPDYTLYGTVRDERGRILPANSAWVIVSNAAGEVVRCPVAATPEEGVNYLVRVPMDSGTVGTNYLPTAMMPTVGFTADADLGWTSRLGSTATMTSISNCAKLHLQSYSTAEN
jgi:hypothetical protein